MESTQLISSERERERARAGNVVETGSPSGYSSAVNLEFCEAASYHSFSRRLAAPNHQSELAVLKRRNLNNKSRIDWVGERTLHSNETFWRLIDGVDTKPRR